jgi:hypothetical protein
VRYLYTSFGTNTPGEVLGRIHICTNLQESLDSIRGYSHVALDIEDQMTKAVTRLSGRDEIEEWCDIASQNLSWCPPAAKMEEKQDHILDTLVLSETDGFHVKSPDKPLSGAGMTLGELKVKAVGRNTGRSISQAVDPAHYQSYLSGEGIPELQWLEAKQYQRPWRDPDAFIAAVLLQADKYLSRLGGKDEEVQEILKGIWYLKFVAAFIANGKKPIRVKDIPALLKVA